MEAEMTGPKRFIIFTFIAILIVSLSYVFAAEEWGGGEEMFLAAKDKRFLLSTARKSIEHHFKGKKYTPNLKDYPHLVNMKAGVFVTIDRHTDIRGCRGTLDPYCPDVVQEVCKMAVASAMRGERYSPINPGELKECRISITIVQSLIPISTVKNVTKSDGIVFKTGGKAGVVLPYEGSDPYTRLKWAYLKVGIEPAESLLESPLKDIFLMKAIRFADGDPEMK
ncbi:MAG: AMMECR1 family protein [Candidatus Eremiobacteraeota bacterium]|nr:AMMECR1 family protein [Candidatus Eremiobacteraeota bacterium]